MSEDMIVVPLGGGQEVGRSCILLQYQKRQILLDCGLHPGRESTDALPFFDALENTEDIDMILITHFHIDHCAALPYFTERTNFKGKIYMTHATKAVMKLLLADNIRLHSKYPPLYTEQDLQNCIDKVDVIDYYQTIEYKGIKVTATAAGHVLGAAMFTIDIDNIKVLYTGDYSLEPDRHLIQAELPPGGPPDVLIVESTFGTTNVPPREKREAEFTATVEDIVSRGGSCLIPVFALGRAQELLLILEEYWHAHPELQQIPIYYASKLASRSLKVYQTFINTMNQHIKEQNDHFHNPFALRYIKNIQQNTVTNTGGASTGTGNTNIGGSHGGISESTLINELYGPCVVIASPGFLQSGISRQLLETWCDDAKHGVIIAGYTVEGTMAHELLSLPNEIKCLDNRIKPRRCQIEHITFSAHVDYEGNRKFIQSVNADYVVLVHGEKTQMKRLKDSLDGEIRRNQWPSSRKPIIATPENGMRVKLRFRKNILAEVVGTAAGELLKAIDQQTSTNETQSQQQQQQQQVTQQIGLPERVILVTENFSSKLVSVEEIAQYTNCRVNRVKEQLMLPLPSELTSILLHSSEVIHELYQQQQQQQQHSTDQMYEEESPEFRRKINFQQKLQTFQARKRVILSLIFDHLQMLYDRISFDENYDRLFVEQLITIDLVIQTQPTNSPPLTFNNPSNSPQSTCMILLMWVGSTAADLVADSVASLIMQLFSAHSLVRKAFDDHARSLPTETSVNVIERESHKGHSSVNGAVKANVQDLMQRKQQKRMESDPTGQENVSNQFMLEEEEDEDEVITSSN